MIFEFMSRKLVKPPGKQPGRQVVVESEVSTGHHQSRSRKRYIIGLDLGKTNHQIQKDHKSNLNIDSKRSSVQN